MRYSVGRQLLGDIALTRTLEAYDEGSNSKSRELGRDLEPRPASLLWSSTYADEIKLDVTIETNKRRHMFPFEKSFQIPGYIFNPTGESWEGVKERMQKVYSLWWKDAKTYRSKDAHPEGNIQLNGGAFRFRVRKIVLRSAGFANT